MSFVHMLNLGDVFLRPLSVCFAGRVGRTSLEWANSRYVSAMVSTQDICGKNQRSFATWIIQLVAKELTDAKIGGGTMLLFFSFIFGVCLIAIQMGRSHFQNPKDHRSGEDLIQRLTFLVDAGLQP